jgi:hypothetical protein
MPITLCRQKVFRVQARGPARQTRLATRITTLPRRVDLYFSGDRVRQSIWTVIAFGGGFYGGNTVRPKVPKKGLGHRDRTLAFQHLGSDIPRCKQLSIRHRKRVQEIWVGSPQACHAGGSWNLDLLQKNECPLPCLQTCAQKDCLQTSMGVSQRPWVHC